MCRLAWMNCCNDCAAHLSMETKLQWKQFVRSSYWVSLQMFFFISVSNTHNDTNYMLGRMQYINEFDGVAVFYFILNFLSVFCFSSLFFVWWLFCLWLMLLAAFVCCCACLLHIVVVIGVVLVFVVGQTSDTPKINNSAKSTWALKRKREDGRQRWTTCLQILSACFIPVSLSLSFPLYLSRTISFLFLSTSTSSLSLYMYSHHVLTP